MIKHSTKLDPDSERIMSGIIRGSYDPNEFARLDSAMNKRAKILIAIGLLFITLSDIIQGQFPMITLVVVIVCFVFKLIYNLYQ